MDDNIEKLQNRISALPETATPRKQWVAQQLLQLLQIEKDTDATELLKLIINEPQNRTVSVYYEHFEEIFD
jgi:hypothetical protein